MASRNDLCYCGSGKEYSVCCHVGCIQLRASLSEVREKFREDGMAREQYVQTYGHVRRPVGVLMDGKIWMAHAGQIFEQIREGPYNFVDALHDHALHFFGDEILDLQESMPLHKRHPAIQWMHRHVEVVQLLGQSKSDGNAAAWYRFAYDLFTIRDNETLSLELRSRLLDPLAFQAARYELKVAAICSTAGFDLHFENESDNRRRHPEFVGVDRASGTRIAVEAKSRHRRGVLGFRGGVDQLPGHKVDVRKNVLDAYRKQAEYPFYVFVDVNLPPASATELSRWEEELNSLMIDLRAEGYASPCPANAVFFTNDPSHYIGSDDIGSDKGRLWVRCATSLDPVVSHPNENVIERLLNAHKQRVSPPVDFSSCP